VPYSEATWTGRGRRITAAWSDLLPLLTSATSSVGVHSNLTSVGLVSGATAHSDRSVAARTWRLWLTARAEDFTSGALIIN
jgi:hypothetical protein